jgi:uncharacterized protein YecE (DUF72 family)
LRRVSTKLSAETDKGSIHLGTSAFTADGWQGAFYPPGMKPADFLSYYATKFDTVEVDSTFYHAPTAATVTGWARKTPDHFIFALKVPQIITHEKVLVDCDDEFKNFVSIAELLGDKLGPMLFQFGYFNRSVFTDAAQFIARLKPFVGRLPKGRQFAVEIRNKEWLTAEFFDLLRQHNVAYALTDQSWMPGPSEIFAKVDPITANFTYIRWLGDRKEIERMTKVWNRIVLDRTAEMISWVDVCKKIQRRGVTIYAYFNNHYAGFSPASVQLFRDTCIKNGLEIPAVVPPPVIERTLFD